MTVLNFSTTNLDYKNGLQRGFGLLDDERLGVWIDGFGFRIRHQPPVELLISCLPRPATC